MAGIHHAALRRLDGDDYPPGTVPVRVAVCRTPFFQPDDHHARSGDGIRRDHAGLRRSRQLAGAKYRVRSTSGEKTLGQAIPSVSPRNAAAHFNKTECFCFSQQALEGYETRDMPLRFVVGNDISKTIDQITLSYTFFSQDQG